MGVGMRVGVVEKRFVVDRGSKWRRWF